METVTVDRTQKWIATHVTTPSSAWSAPVDCLTQFDVIPADPQNTGSMVANMVRGTIPNDGQEHLFVLALDAHGKPLARSIVAVGSVDQCPLFARDIYAWALTVPRVRFVGVAHNHPSGDVTPSGPDKTGTRAVAQIGAALGLDLVWSMVVTHESTVWALVPITGGGKPQPQEEPYAPKPIPEDEDEDEGSDSEDGEESEEDGEESEDEGSDSEEDGEGSEDGSEDGEMPQDEPEPEEGGVEYDKATPPPPTSTNGATIDDVRAAILAAFKIKG